MTGHPWMGSGSSWRVGGGGGNVPGATIWYQQVHTKISLSYCSPEKKLKSGVKNYTAPPATIYLIKLGPDFSGHAPPTRLGSTSLLTLTASRNMARLHAI